MSVILYLLFYYQQYSQQFIVISEDYEQGLRRLNRSLERTDLLSSSECESQVFEKEQPLIMGPSHVAMALAQQKPLNGKSKKKPTQHSPSLDDQSATEGIVVISLIINKNSISKTSQKFGIKYCTYYQKFIIKINYNQSLKDITKSNIIS